MLLLTPVHATALSKAEFAIETGKGLAVVFGDAWRAVESDKFHGASIECESFLRFHAAATSAPRTSI